MKDIYPEFADDVAFYAVGAHYGIVEDVDTLIMYGESRGYPWPVAASSVQMLADFNITLQSTKIAFDSEGFIIYRGNMGQGSDEEWRRLFTEMSESGKEQ
ncbi:MAG: hypothetical protein OXE17_08805 [Chloroflexi bacterium]|nr:hypothetical protein [Chloroflexota bacterium]